MPSAEEMNTLSISYKGHRERGHITSLNFSQNFYRSVPYLSLNFSHWIGEFQSNSDY